MVRLVTRRLFTNHAGHCTGWSLASFIIPNGNLLNLTSYVFLHSELMMTNASQRKPTLFLVLCSFYVIVHLPTLPLPSYKPVVAASLYSLFFLWSSFTIRFLCLGGNCSVSIFTEQILKISSSDWCLQKDFFSRSVYARQWLAIFCFCGEDLSVLKHNPSFLQGH